MKQPDPLFNLVQAIVAGDVKSVRRQLARSPELARTSAQIGATRANASEFFFEEIRHYLYAGDSALHFAAAAFRPTMVQLLIDGGADVAAANRRGAQPLHYAADANVWNPKAQAATIACLLRAGAAPNALDKSGVAPLHRAVRTRSEPAVRALLDGGASVQLANKRGSTPLQLALANTGRSGSGEARSKEQQQRIVQLLLERGAKA